MKSVLLSDINPNYTLYDDGRIYSFISYKFLKPKKAGNGKGFNVDIRCEHGKFKGKRRSFMINQLVYNYFVEKIDLYTNDYVIDYIDRNFKNCHFTNLKKINRSDFTSEKVSKGELPKIKDIYPENPRKSILSQGQCSEIKRLVDSGVTKRSLAKKYGVSEMSILRAYRRTAQAEKRTFSEWLKKA